MVMVFVSLEMIKTSDADAQDHLGWMYYYGRGVGKDYSTAKEWYRNAAEQGHSNAQDRLELMYEYGHGVDKNLSTAVEWYRKAAEQGDSDAQRSLDRLT